MIELTLKIPQGAGDLMQIQQLFFYDETLNP